MSPQSVHTWLERYRQERITGQFLGGWLARDPIRLGPSLEDFVHLPARHRAAGPGPGPLRLSAWRRWQQSLFGPDAAG